MKWESSQKGLELAKKYDKELIAKLIDSAIEARSKSYVPYSNFAVGAGLLLASGDIVQGSNIESCSYTPTNCAERSAIFSAISRTGERNFEAIAIVGADKDTPLEEAIYCAPCGVCRQVLAEFVQAEKFLIILAKSQEDYLVFTLDELFPLGFYPSSL